MKQEQRNETAIYSNATDPSSFSAMRPVSFATNQDGRNAVFMDFFFKFCFLMGWKNVNRTKRWRFGAGWRRRSNVFHETAKRRPRHHHPLRFNGGGEGVLICIFPKLSSHLSTAHRQLSLSLSLSLILCIIFHHQHDSHDYNYTEKPLTLNRNPVAERWDHFLISILFLFFKSTKMMK